MNSQPGIGGLGRFGWDLNTTTGAQTSGNWFAILCLSATVFATLTDVGPNSRTGTIGSALFPAGALIYGAFTNFTLTSGSVIAYRTRNAIANPGSAS